MRNLNLRKLIQFKEANSNTIKNDFFEKGYNAKTVHLLAYKL